MTEFIKCNNRFFNTRYIKDVNFNNDKTFSITVRNTESSPQWSQDKIVQCSNEFASAYTHHLYKSFNYQSKTDI